MQDEPRPSLLSLSIAAANAAPLPKHRRLSSAGRSKRRLSDARDAATRVHTRTPSSPSIALAALSLASPTLEHDPDDARLSVSPPTKSRKRGTIFTCESCSKIYRHPSCLIKHRWEHTPQWREASKFVLSKHQQVQLLEAAAILSHLSPSSASLPEDRSLWPAFLSGGLVPPPSDTPSTASHTPLSSSVPGPRLHAYTIGDGVTHVRPGMVGVSTTEDDARTLLALRSGPSVASAPERERGYPSGWSLPRSSVRSKSGSSTGSTRSASESRSDDEDEDEGLDEYRGYGMRARAQDVDVDDDGEDEGDGDKASVEPWDGMDMDMDMD